MVVELHNAKSLPEALELDVHKRPRAFRRWGWWIIVGSFPGALLLFVGLYYSQGQDRLYQAGPLTQPHAMLQQNCQVCHTQAFATLGRLLPGGAGSHSVPDAACVQCHQGPRHQSHLLPEKEGHCVECHREHRGHDALVRLPDGQCVQCHGSEARLAEAVGGREKLKWDLRPVGSWDGHPDFKPRWENTPENGRPTDPGTLRFNHHKHLHTADPRGLPMLDEKMFAGQWKEAAPRPEPTWKKLTCTDCHQADEAGRYMKPVTYDQHCRQCHPLYARPSVDLPENNKARAALAELVLKPVPHREPEVVRGVLWDRLLELIRANKEDLKLPAVKEEPLLPLGDGWPRPPGVSAPEQQLAARWRAEMEEQLFDVLDADRQDLPSRLRGCQYCHVQEKRRNVAAGELPHYLPSRINERRFPLLGRDSSRWLPFGSFKHDSHRLLNCQACHDKEQSTRTAEISMPTVGSCRQCHGTQTGASARGNCLECHLYHPDKGEKNGRLAIPPIVDGKLAPFIAPAPGKQP
jgi:hypothetical protein